MSRFLDRTTLALATLLLATAPTAAVFAGEGSGLSYPGDQLPDVALSQAAAPAPVRAGGLVIGGTLPPVANGEGEPEPVNSLPPGFENGTVEMQHRQALQQYWHEHGMRSLNG